MPDWLWGVLPGLVVSVLALAVAFLQFRASQRYRTQLEVARGSELLCEVTLEYLDVGRRLVKVQQGPGEQSWVHITFRAQLTITNKSERPNSIRSIRLDVRGARPFGLPGLVLVPEPKLMETHLPDYGDPLLTPLNISAGVITVQRYVAFEVEFVDPRFDKEATDLTLLIVDGHGRLYEVGRLEEP